jgi:predicted methyltransferase
LPDRGIEIMVGPAQQRQGKISMHRYLMSVGAGLVVSGLLFSANALAADKVPAYIAAAVADSARPDTDKARDANRKPAETLAFAGVKPGETVVDYWPGGGYFTRIFSKIVGPKGHVYALSPPGLPEKMTAAAKALAADPSYTNISESEQEISTLPAGSIDLFWTSQNYHDIHNMKDVDIAAIDKSIFDALKPGGLFVVLDHVATPGSGVADTSTLHRIAPDAVKKEVEAAGFKLGGESDLLKNPDDPHTAKVFDPAIRGKTDQFILKFMKPKK